MSNITQYVLQELEKQPLILKDLFLALAHCPIKISPHELYRVLNNLIDRGWIEYYELKANNKLQYELSNHWYNLEELERNRILGDNQLEIDPSVSTQHLINMAKIKFGTYEVQISVTIEDELDIEDYFTQEKWNKLKGSKQKEWLEGYCKSLAVPDLEISWKLKE
jgi:DNA-binding PadR family transcriptional regulator